MVPTALATHRRLDNLDHRKEIGLRYRERITPRMNAMISISLEDTSLIIMVSKETLLVKVMRKSCTKAATKISMNTSDSWKNESGFESSRGSLSCPELSTLYDLAGSARS